MMTRHTEKPPSQSTSSEHQTSQPVTRRKSSKTTSFGTPARIGHDSRAYYGSRLYEGMPIESPSEPDNPLPPNLRNQIFLHTAEQMTELPDRSIHLMITSPPYNAGKTYDENLSLPEYLDFLRRVFGEVYRVLVHGGRACINIANLGRKPYIPLSSHITRLMLELGFLMRGEIIWDKGAGAGTSMAWGSWCSPANPVLRDTHEYILIFSKGSFRREGKGQTTDLTRETFMEWTKSVWRFQPESAKRVGHPAPFPVELPLRLIQLYSFVGDVVLDPFMGSGTTAIAALRSGRQYVGYEIDADYVALAQRRIAIVQNELNL